MSRQMPSERKKKFSDLFIKGQTRRAAPTFESKLKEAHQKYFEEGQKREAGHYSAEQTGAKALAKRRAEYVIRKAEEEIVKRAKRSIARRMV